MKIDPATGQAPDVPPGPATSADAAHPTGSAKDRRSTHSAPTAVGNAARDIPHSPHRPGSTFGRLIGVSLGPGDPDLITRRGWTALQSGARWTYPVKKAESGSYALDIVRRGGLAVPGDAEALVFPMTRDALALARAWARAAARTVALLAEGRDVVFLVEGDASTFSTFGHLARTVRELAPTVDVETIPGISSFAAASARVQRPLAEEDDTFAVVPAAYGIDVIARLLPDFDTLILLKVKPLLDDLIDLLAARGLLGQACFVEKVGSPEERVVHDVAGLRGEKVNYLSLLLVRNPGRIRGELQRGCRKKPTVVVAEEAPG
ncbi:precorrin-2 C(20)-methyltransferase [Azoarcus olearius]|uniref:precorrin-2 C(20)-methyltransferase n=1 Tax=Azoarcus sp. (strain BH72) TaxID=418699 RepID=UPI00080609D3|nr:precorrin-2 C(20)-methyltransferase [Azoarcus olearius]ANQ86694.1 precorrin-2 C(20)-methyltransferase [Azoarcus olearius]